MSLKVIALPGLGALAAGALGRKLGTTGVRIVAAAALAVVAFVDVALADFLVSIQLGSPSAVLPFPEFLASTILSPVSPSGEFFGSLSIVGRMPDSFKDEESWIIVSASRISSSSSDATQSKRGRGVDQNNAQA
jgi:hypothetical protein